MSTVTRETSLDGLRGWAAISVCLYHFVWELFGVRFPELRNLALGLFCNGRLAVSVFFVLTGYVLTIGSWGPVDKGGVRRQLVKRYFRLSIPIIFAVGITMIVIEAGLARDMLSAGSAIGRPEWLGNFLRFDPTWTGAAVFALAFTYWPVPVHLSYNAFLWTMPYELFGSYFVLLLCLAGRGIRLSVATLATLSAFFLTAGDFSALAACFSLGAALAALRQDGALPRSPGWLPVLLATLGVVGGAWVQLMSWPAWGTVLCATTVVACVVSSDKLGAMLSSPVSRQLGRLSYPIYLMQFPVLISLSSTLIVGSEAGGYLNLTTAIAIGAASLTAVVVAALPFGWVERLTALVTRYLDTLLSRRFAAQT